MRKRPELQRERAELFKLSAEDGASAALSGRPGPPNTHPEIKKLRRLQQREASRVLAASFGPPSLQLALASPQAKIKPRKRNYTSTAKRLLGHCSVCGAIAHRRIGCPFKDSQGEGLPEKALQTIAWQRGKAMYAVISRLKYTHIPGRFDRRGG